MILKIKFKSAGGYEYETLRTEWDRNYEDESTAMVFVESEEDDFDGYYEVNMMKDADGKLTGSGYVCVYDSEDDTAPSSIIHDAELHLTEHGFDETLREANETLRPFGKRIFADYDGDSGYWSVGSTDMDGGNPDYYVDADLEHEVRGHITECLAHVLARVKNPDLWQQGQDRMAQIRQLWGQLNGMEQVDLMVEFYWHLMDGEKDRFLRETDNP